MLNACIRWCCFPCSLLLCTAGSVCVWKWLFGSSWFWFRINIVISATLAATFRFRPRFLSSKADRTAAATAASNIHSDFPRFSFASIVFSEYFGDRSLSLSLSLSPFVTEHVMDRSHALSLNTPRKEAQLIMFECHPKCVCVCVCTVHTDRMESWTLHLHWLTGAAAAALQQCLQSLGTNGETLISPLAQSFRRCYGVGVFAC